MQSQRVAPLLALCAGLGACGGDSGGGGGNSPPPQGPGMLSIDAPSVVLVTEGTNKAFDFVLENGTGAGAQVVLSGADGDHFRREEGSVFFRQAPDFEEPAAADNRYVLRVEVSAGGVQATADVVVEVQDVAEARVVDGPVADAIVFVDLNGDGVQNPGERSTLSDATGYVVIPPHADDGGHLITVGGRDTFTGESLGDFTMIAPLPTEGTRTLVVSPLSTLLSSLEVGDPTRDALLESLGASGDEMGLLTRDLWREAPTSAQASKLLTLAQQVAFTLQALGASVVDPSIDPLQRAQTMRALVRELAVELAAPALAPRAWPIDAVLAATATIPGTVTLDLASREALASAIATITSMWDEPDWDPASDAAAALLAVTQRDTTNALLAVRDGTDTPETFATQQTSALALALASVDSPSADADGDGLIDLIDPDNDGDGVADARDTYPDDPERGDDASDDDRVPPACDGDCPPDTDGDGLTDDIDPDDDGDTVADLADANPLDPLVSAPATLNATQAFKLLSMASFGATPALRDELVTLGAEGWVDAQLTMASAYTYPDDDWPTHLERTMEIAAAYTPTVNYFEADPNDGTVIFNERSAQGFLHRFQMAAWSDNVFGSPNHPALGRDQLRQRMAYALSQLLVTSSSMPPLDQHTEGLAYYYDLLAEHAFGNYRDLLGAVARSPAMGVFLSHTNNQKANAEDATRPDENFARELVQLFTLGLYQLDASARVLTDEAGRPRAVYTQTDIEELAKVVTGWHLAGARDSQRLRSADGDYTRPMAFDPSLHEDEQDPYYGDTGDGVITLLGQSVALDAADRTPDGNGNSTRSGLDAALDVLFAHPNVAPFVSRHLIAHFVTANPTPAYVARIAGVFDDDGTGAKGNLGAVLKAILLDREAFAQDPASGDKIKEPLLAYTQLLRALDVTPVPDGFMTDRQEVPVAGAGVNIIYEADLASVIGYAPLRANSVFNFFETDFVPADPDLTSAALRAPEMAMMTDQYFANFANFVEQICNARERVQFDRGLAERRVRTFSSIRVYDIDFTRPLTAMELAMEGDGNLDFATINQVEAYGAQNNKSIAVEALVQWIDEQLFGQGLPSEYREALTQHLRDGMHRDEGRDDTPEQRASKRLDEAVELVRDALVMATAMPPYLVQR